MPERTNTEVAVILLAAGPSVRMGTPKQLLLYKGRTLVRHLTEVALASKAKSTYVVLGAESDRVKRELSDLPATILESAHWVDGMSASLRAGLAALPANVHGAIVMLCDQPLVTTGLLDTLIDAHETSGRRIVACSYAGTVGVPALFDRSLFGDLLGLSGDRGAKQIITQYPEDVCLIPFPDGSVDLDTPADYQRHS